MDLRLLSKTLGGFLIFFSLILLVPSLASFVYDQKLNNEFFSAMCISVLLGLLFWFINRNYQADLNIKTSFGFVACSWLFAGFIGALPYYFSYTLPTFPDAFFESISGFTGTGASVMTNIEACNPVLLFWRSLTQWLGGIGIIIFFIALLPILGVGGVQIFRVESTGPQNEKMAPRIQAVARNLWIIYLGFTVTLCVILHFLGMSWFDALNHGLTGAATGGFSTKNAGIAAFQSSAIEYTMVIFMLLSSISFAIHFRIITGVWKKLSALTELKYYLSIITIFTLLICLAQSTAGLALEQAFRSSLFTVVATATSTGYTNYNYVEFPVFIQLALILLMVMGGMSGSTAGGVKCIRLVAAFKLLRKELKQFLHPHAVLSVKANGHTIEAKVASAIWGFLFVYFFTFSLITMALCLEGTDLVSAATATVAMISNIGPAFGEFGSYSNYSSLSDVSKFLMSVGMLLGRLEFFAILVLFTPDFWKKY